MTMILSRPMEVHLTNSTKRARAIPVQGERTEIDRWLRERTQQQAAREYAETWHRDLRLWRVRVPVILRPTLPYSSGGLDAISTLGEFLPDQKTALLTPIGEVGEAEVVAHITRMQLSGVPDLVVLGGFLERYSRSKPTPMSLMDPRGGWASPRPRSAAYAVAVLSLAARLGDPHTHLAEYTRACRLAVGVDVADFRG